MKHIIQHDRVIDLPTKYDDEKPRLELLPAAVIPYLCPEGKQLAPIVRALSQGSLTAQLCLQAYEALADQPTDYLGVCKVMEYGAEKYNEFNYLLQDGLHPPRLIGACLRHYVAIADNPTDVESGLPHRWHALANLLMCAEILIKRAHPGTDDLELTPQVV